MRRLGKCRTCEILFIVHAKCVIPAPFYLFFPVFLNTKKCKCIKNNFNQSVLVTQCLIYPVFFSQTEKGFCVRGDLCLFDHGNDPLIVDDVNLPNMIPFPPPPVMPPPGLPMPPIPEPPPSLRMPSMPPYGHPPPGVFPMASE